MHPSFFAGLLGSLLPASLRPRWLNEHLDDLRTPAIISGLGQMVGCFAALGFRYLPFVHSQMASIDTRAMLAGAEKAGETSVMTVGLVVTIAYFIQPLSITFLYFALEGAVRAIAAFIHNEPVGTLPLYLLLVVGKRVKNEVREHELGERVADKVLPAPDGETGYDLVVASCRPKNWNASLTISYEGQLYELARPFEAAPPWRFVYLLRKAPASKLVRGLHHYDPQEGLTAEVAVER